MPFKKGGKKPMRRTRKGGFKGKRFTKGKYVKSTSAQVTIKGQQIPNTMSMKLNWDKTLVAQELGSGSVNNYSWLGNSLDPIPLGAPSSYAPSTGDQLPPNMAQLVLLYAQAVTSGSAIKVRIQSTAVVGGEIQGVLVALPYYDQDAVSATSLPAVVTGFNSLSFDDASALPYAHRFMFNANSGASNSSHQFKGFRKCKVMCGTRILKDNPDFIQDVSQSETQFTTPNRGFVWLLKIKSSVSTDAEPITYTLQTKLAIYTSFISRRQTTQTILA